MKDEGSNSLFSNTDRDWEYYGKNDPYYGVFTSDEFRSSTLGDEQIARFFQSGEEYIEQILGTIYKCVDSEFSPNKVLDFGCGVGRLVIPLAKRFDSVTGVDVSRSMIVEAEKNCIKFNLSNVEFVQSDDRLSLLSGTFDLIHSYIVFQHIPVRRGEAIFRQLLNTLNPGGVGVLQFIYRSNPLKRVFDAVPFANTLYSIYKGKPIGDRPIQMNQYNLNSLFAGLQSAGCQNLYISFTRHANNYGVTLFFQKE
ncbi:MAG: class I SAM-dependent methyltransferase [Chloroflexi bacterium AL-N5]|nr:class I SAM-dependent methyltransferase [Chloroflexi bacterium AL-N5]